VDNFNTPLHQYISHPNKKLNKETSELNDPLDQMNLSDIYRIFHLIAIQRTFFLAAHVTSFKIDHILGHRASLNKYKKIEITFCILSSHNEIKIEIINKRNYRKYSNP
jgi:hypothetical protein